MSRATCARTWWSLSTGAAATTGHFLTPLGVGDRLVGWGVPAAKVQQLDWWGRAEVAGVQFVATPAQHFSGRTMSDRNKTLWASCVIQHQGLKVYFSGDTGYFKGFKEIGEKYGPFDLGLHTWKEPFEPISALATANGTQMTTPQMGEPINLEAPAKGTEWCAGLE